jgi:hypothetical protein
MQEQPSVGDATPKTRPERAPREAQTGHSRSQPAEQSESAGTPQAEAAVSAHAPPAADGPAARKERPAAGGESPATGPSALVTLPGVHRQEQPRTSFWQRIRLSRRGVRSATDDDRMISRLDAIASRIEEREQDLSERIVLLDQRLNEVWEVEEQLSRLMELREMLGDIQERQGRIDSRTRTLARRLSWIAMLAAVSAVAALAAAAVALL